MMESSKADQVKPKLKGKLPCSSKLSSKFIESETRKGFSLSFSTVPSSLCDFIPNDQESLSYDVDFDIAKNLKKLEKKDPVTKRKSLNDLLDMFDSKDKSAVISTLKFWPKLYNKLSLDDDKKVRELTQQLMGKYSHICGKEISVIIKHLLPTWIIAQSDLHLEAGNIAKQTFFETFPTPSKQEKAYLLCWRSIYEILSTTLSKTPIQIKEDSVSYTAVEEFYIQDIVVDIRTIITLLPYLKTNEEAIQDLITLLTSKSFWNHFKQNINPIQSMYIQLNTELLNHIPEVVKCSAFLSSNVCECFRMIDNCHQNILKRIWVNVMKCHEHLKDQVWKFVSFKTVFLPKLLKLFECAADGNISQIYSYMLPFFTHIPVELESAESDFVHHQILVAMIKSTDCVRVTNNELEANCALRMILECSVYTMIVASNKNNAKSVNSHFTLLMEFIVKYFTETRMKKSTNAIPSFVNCFIVPIVTKNVVPKSQIIGEIISWIEEFYENSLFCDNLVSFLLELDKCVCDQISPFQISLLELIEAKLKDKIDGEHKCILISYFYVCFFKKELNIWSEADSDSKVLTQCSYLIQDCSPLVTDIISRGLSQIICNSSKFDNFLKSLTDHQINIFYTRFYEQFMNQIESNGSRSSFSFLSLSLWENIIKTSVESILGGNTDTCPVISYHVLFDLCEKIDSHKRHAETLIGYIDEIITTNVNALTLVDNIDQIFSLLKECISKATSDPSIVMVDSFIKNFLKLVLCHDIDVDFSASHLKIIFVYLQQCSYETQLALSKDLIDETIAFSHDNDFQLTTAIKSIMEHSTETNKDQLIAHIDSIILKDILAVEEALEFQIPYSSTMVNLEHKLVIAAIHKINVFNSLELTDLNISLRTNIDCACILVNCILTKVFSSCQNSNDLLNQCEKIHKSAQSLDLSYYQDRLLISGITRESKMAYFDKCPTLVLCALQHLIPSNYSEWSQITRDAIDLSMNTWTESELPYRHFEVITRVFFPCAIKARYLVREMIIATLISYLSDDVQPTIDHINRAIKVMSSLVRADPSYFPVCYPILMGVKSKFDTYIDRLHPVEISNQFSNENYFHLTGLLEFLFVGVNSYPIDQNQWEFIFCLLDTLIRSEPFSNCGNYRSKSIIDNQDHLLNGYWVLKVLSSVTVTLVTVKIDSVIDEWVNFFSEPIYTTILDQFSLVSGDHTLGKLVHSDLFTFYLEALSDAVSLCPTNILLNHNFVCQININDPIDLPKEFLVVYNSLLDSMSSCSLSVQLAAYNCLLNLTEKLSDLLLEQVVDSEKVETLELFSINLPHKLLDYMATENLDHLHFDQLDHQIIFTRCFLSWNIVLQLFFSAQPKLRGEISSFLFNNDRCFDKFLNYCFTFMPKNPVVNKKHLTFLGVNNSCNLITEEPDIFTHCLEKRSKFIIYHLSAYIFRRCMQILPNMCRNWWHSLETNSQQLVDAYVRHFLTKELFKIEFDQLKEVVNKELDDKIEIKTIHLVGEVTVKYNISVDQSLAQLLKLPNNYPIGIITTECKTAMTAKLPHWKHWVKQMTVTLETQNGSIFDGIKIWKRNLDDYFNGVEECMICYSILHPMKYTLPSMPCYQCKKKFHKDCMLKWFDKSTNPTCPNCRNRFYDGSQKGTK